MNPNSPNEPVQGGVAPLTPRALAKRTLILDAAAEVLAQRGYASTTLAEIAERAGTLAGSLYYHFASRDELITEVLLRGIGLVQQRILEAVHALGADATEKDRLEVGLRAHLEFVLQESAYALAGVNALGQLPEAINAAIRPVNEVFEQFVLDLFTNAAAEGSIDASVNLPALQLLIAGAINRTAQWHNPDEQTTATEIADLLVRLLFTGISPSQL